MNKEPYPPEVPAIQPEPPPDGAAELGRTFGAILAMIAWGFVFLGIGFAANAIDDLESGVVTFIIGVVIVAVVTSPFIYKEENGA